MASVQSKRVAASVAFIVLGLAAGLGLAEAWVRFARWTPRIQVIRGHGLRAVDGVPVWEDSTDRHNRACVEQHPERTRILFFGSSITYGASLTAPETFASRLQDQLNTTHPTPGFCVLNFAQPSFQFEQKYAVARAEVTRYRPAVIMWESWVEWRQLRLIGDAAYSISDFQLRPDGFIAIAGVPDWLNHALFPHSRLYEYLTLEYGELNPEQVIERERIATFANNELIKMVQLAESVGAKLVLYFTPPLDRPFAETVASPSDSNTVLREFAQAHGVCILFRRAGVDRSGLSPVAAHRLLPLQRRRASRAGAGDGALRPGAVEWPARRR